MKIENDVKVKINKEEVNFKDLINTLLAFLTDLFNKYPPEELK